MDQDPRMLRMREESSVIIPAVYSAISGDQAQDELLGNAAAVHQYYAEHYTENDVAEVVGVYEGSTKDNMAWMQLVANLIGKVVASKISMAEGIAKIPDTKIRDDAIGGIVSAVNINTHLLLPAYLCAKTGFTETANLSDYVTDLTFGDLATIFSSEDYIRLNYRATKTAQIAYSANSFNEDRDSVINIGEVFDHPVFLNNWVKAHGEWPSFKINELCEKDEDGTVYFSERFDIFLRSLLHCVNETKRKELSIPETVEPLDKAGSIGCPITYRAKNSLSEVLSGDDANIQDDIVIRSFLRLLSRQYRLLDDNTPVIGFRPFSLVKSK